MFVEIKDTLVRSEPTKWNGENPAIAYFTLEELRESASVLKIDLQILEELQERKNPESFINAWEDYSFGCLYLLEVGREDHGRDLAGIYLSSDLFVLIHLFDEDGSIESAFRRSLEQPGVLRGGIPRVLSLFFKDMIRGHNNLYDRLREQIEFLEDKVWSSKKVDQLIGEEISEINHELLLLYNYYEQLSDFCETLEDNENEIFTEKGLGHIRSLNTRITRYAANISRLREYLHQVRENFQSKQDFQLNQTVTIFTVVTTIFLPLTLLAGWYGMNFKYMPELYWRYGYLGVFILSVLIVIISIYYFKKKKLL